MERDFPGRLQELLHTNNPLDDQEIDLVRDVLRQREVSICTTMHKAMEIDLQIEELTKQRNALAFELNQYQKDFLACSALLSRFRDLPSELLGPIFLYSLPDYQQTTSFTSPAASLYHNIAPFSLTQVCSRWRALALAMPELWTSISIRTSASSKLKVRYEPFKTMVATFFSRAGGHPTSLDFHYGHDVHLKYETDVDGLILSAFDSIPIHHLSLGSVDLPSFLRALDRRSTKAHINLDLRNLQTITLRETMGFRSTPPPSDSESDEESDAHSTIKVLSRNVPKLRRVTIEHRRDRHFVNDLLHPQFFPWRQLTHISIADWVDRSTWSPIFDQCTSLIHATFYITEGLLEPQDTPLTPYPNLLSLTIIYKARDSDDYQPFVFRPYTFPSLKRLRLGLYDQPQHHSYSTGYGGCAFDWRNIQTELFNLTTLSMHNLAWEAKVSDIIQLLHATPNVLSLSLGISMDYSRVFERFQVDWDGQSLVPHLIELTIDCANSPYTLPTSRTSNTEDSPPSSSTPLPLPSISSSPTSFSFTSRGFSDMVKERWQPLEDCGISQLKRVSLFLPRTYEPVMERIRASLTREVKEGLQLIAQTAQTPQWKDPLLGHRVVWSDDEE